MSIATEIQRLQTAKSDLKTAIEAKGVTVPSATTIDGYATLVGQIQGQGLSYTTGTITLSSSSTSITIPYSSVTGKATVYLVHQSPTYGINGCIGFFGTNYFFEDVTIQNSNSRVFGVLETRTTSSDYSAAYFGYYFTFSVNANNITVGVRNNSYPYQAGTYDYLIIENK